MALTFTGTLSVATAERSEVREMLIGALGCNIAWGLVDAVMFLLAALAERGRNIAILRRCGRRPTRPGAPADPGCAAASGRLDDAARRGGGHPGSGGSPARARPPHAHGGGLADGVAVFLLVFLATLPVALPFAFMHEAHRALRLSNGIALAMLFLGGYYLGGHAGRHPG
jgi:hypothetical protein